MELFRASDRLEGLCRRARPTKSSPMHSGPRGRPRARAGGAARRRPRARCAGSTCSACTTASPTSPTTRSSGFGAARTSHGRAAGAERRVQGRRPPPEPKQKSAIRKESSSAQSNLRSRQRVASDRAPEPCHSRSCRARSASRGRGRAGPPAEARPLWPSRQVSAGSRWARASALVPLLDHQEPARARSRTTQVDVATARPARVSTTYLARTAARSPPGRYGPRSVAGDDRELDVGPRPSARARLRPGWIETGATRRVEIRLDGVGIVLDTRRARYFPQPTWELPGLSPVVH